jgi:hypothetical protein
MDAGMLNSSFGDFLAILVFYIMNPYINALGDLESGKASRNNYGEYFWRHLVQSGVLAGRIAGKELLLALGKDRINELIDQVVGMYQALGWGESKKHVVQLESANSCHKDV